MANAFLKPTRDQTFEIIAAGEAAFNFKTILQRSRELQERGEIAEACNLRFKAIQDLQDLLPEDEEISLEWEHPNSQAAIEVVNLSAVDHFLIGDYEIASALLELSLELDGEDHLESSNLLAYCYLAMEEYELFDEVINDISDKNASHELLILWSSYLREGLLPEGELRNFKNRFAAYHTEFTALDHPIDDAYIADIEGAKSSAAAQARELWLRTETLWESCPGFIEALRAN
ncbi:MAG: tetratricopeptide repeat protein [Rikenellaceae bacterium]